MEQEAHLRRAIEASITALRLRPSERTALLGVTRQLVTELYSRNVRVLEG